MLVNRHSGKPIELDSVHNYYERMVVSLLYRQLGDEDMNFLADVACVALNHLPPRYIRHDVDMSFYLSPHESQEMENKVAEAIKHAIEHVRQQKGLTANSAEG